LEVRRLRQVAKLAATRPDPGEQIRLVRQPPAKRWTDDAVKDVIRRYQAGESREQIERDTGYGSDRIKAKLLQAGLDVRGVPFKLTPAMIAEAVRLRGQGESWRTLSQRYGVSAASLRRAVIRRTATDFSGVS